MGAKKAPANKAKAPDRTKGKAAAPPAGKPAAVKRDRKKRPADEPTGSGRYVLAALRDGRPHSPRQIAMGLPFRAGESEVERVRRLGGILNHLKRRGLVQWSGATETAERGRDYTITAEGKKAVKKYPPAAS